MRDLRYIYSIILESSYNYLFILLKSQDLYIS